MFDIIWRLMNQQMCTLSFVYPSGRHHHSNICRGYFFSRIIKRENSSHHYQITQIFCAPTYLVVPRCAHSKFSHRELPDVQNMTFTRCYLLRWCYFFWGGVHSKKNKKTATSQSCAAPWANKLRNLNIPYSQIRKPNWHLFWTYRNL